jgi:hypothetical protein
MSRFEDHLWREFVREHGDSFAHAEKPTAGRGRRPRTGLVAGTGLGLAATGAALVFVLGATSTSPAFAVTRNQDGTVTITVMARSGIAGANARLHALGIRAQVLPQAAIHCSDLSGHGVPAPAGNFSNAHWTIDPRQIPAGRKLSLAPPPTPRGGGSHNGNGGNGASGGTATVWSTATTAGTAASEGSETTGATATTGGTETTGGAPTTQGPATTGATATTESSETSQSTATTESSETSQGTVTNGGSRVPAPPGSGGKSSGWTLSCPQLSQHGHAKPGVGRAKGSGNG